MYIQIPQLYIYNWRTLTHTNQLIDINHVYNQIINNWDSINEEKYFYLCCANLVGVPYVKNLNKIIVLIPNSVIVMLNYNYVHCFINCNTFEITKLTLLQKNVQKNKIKILTNIFSSFFKNKLMMMVMILN